MPSETSEVQETRAPAFAVRFVGDAESGYEIQLENNAGLDDETMAELLGQALEKLDGRTNRAAGLW